MAVYAAYHRHPVNRAIHFLCVPAIVWTLMVALGLVPLFEAAGMAVTLAHVAAFAVLGYYVALDLPLGIVCAAFFTGLLALAFRLTEFGAATALTVAGLVFVASWILQLVGHAAYEKRRPALADNLFQVFMAPLFLVTELAFSLGLRKQLQGEIEERIPQHLQGQAARGAA